MRKRVLFRNVCSIVVSATIASSVLLNLVHAEVVTDGSVGSRLSVQGPEFVIPQSLGSTVGTNLFHSFQSFNISNTQSATFTGANSISNVISRVTGRQLSTIDGVLRSDIGQANFYFINPAGIVFGPDASINVPAAFHASTAANLQFSDGAVFSAVNPGASTLSMVSPSAFGFVANRSAEIRIEQSDLSFSPGTNTSLIGSDIVIESGILTNMGGEIGLTATGHSANSVPLNSSAAMDSPGKIQVSDSRIDVSGSSSGLIVVNGGKIDLTASTLSAIYLGNQPVGNSAGIEINAKSLVLDNTLLTNITGGSGDAGDIDISVIKAFKLLNGSSLTSATSSQGNAGLIKVEVMDLFVDGQNASATTGIFSSVATNSSGEAGDIELAVEGKLSLVNNGTISSNTLTSKNAGSITIQAGNFTIDGQTSTATVINSAGIGSSGDAGKIDISVNNTMSLVDGGSIFNSSLSAGSSGSIQIKSADLTIDSRGNQAFTGVSSSSVSDSTGNSGMIDIFVNANLNLINRGSINSSTFTTEGKAGGVTVVATNITITDQANILSAAGRNSRGTAGDVSVSTRESLRISNGGAIISNTFSEGNAGTITVNTTNLDISNGGSLSSGTASKGNAGLISVHATNMVIDGQGNNVTGIFSRASEESNGNAGNISVSVDKTFDIFHGGKVSNDTFSSRDAGSITVKVADFHIDGLGLLTGLFSSSIGSEDAGNKAIGDAGDIDVSSNNLILVNGGLIGNSTFSKGNAGSIHVLTTNLNIDGQQFTAGLFSDTSGSGNAGEIDVTASRNLNIKSGGRIRNDTFSAGSAGSITVRTTDLRIDGKSSSVTTGLLSRAQNASSGRAGSVTVKANKLVLQNKGTINIQSQPFVDNSVLSVFKPTEVTIQANRIMLEGNSEITAESNGNITASAITINTVKQLNVTDSKITTAANQANGGDITIGGNNVFLNNSQITTSVAGNGNGGDITLTPRVLVLDTGFVQANTAGANATGGNININSEVLISSNNRLQSGGDTQIAFEPNSGLNVIQAAAPDGVNGNISITPPELNISGTLANLDTTLIDIDRLTRDPCASPASKQSKLIRISKGGLPETVEQPLTIPMNSGRLRKMLDLETNPQALAQRLVMSRSAEIHCF